MRDKVQKLGDFGLEGKGLLAHGEWVFLNKRTRGYGPRHGKTIIMGDGTRFQELVEAPSLHALYALML